MNEYTTPQKTCTKCNVAKPATLEYFGTQKRGAFGLRAVCKICIKAYKREYRQANKELIAASKRKYEQANKEAIYKQQYEYRQRKQVELKSIWRNYREANKDKIAAQKRVYRQAKKDAGYSPAEQKRERESGRIRSNRRRARKLSLPVNFTHQNWLDCLEYFHHCCAVCGCQLRDLFGNIKPNADHWMPLSSELCIGTVKENMICLCESCNKSKGAKLPQKWLEGKYSQKKAEQIMERIETYFRSIQNNPNE